MNNLSIKDFYKMHSDNGAISVDKLTDMTVNGLLTINDKQMIYSIDDVAKILNKTKRALTYWVETGKLNVLKSESGNFIVTDEELHRILKETPVAKNRRCIYVKADDIESVNKFIKRVTADIDININKYRSRIFVDIDGDEGITELIRYMLESGVSGVEIYSNVDIYKINPYIKSIVVATNSSVCTVA